MAKKKKFKFTPLQKLWIKSLRAHPERQCSEKLGSIDLYETGIPYKACCLGELVLCEARINKKKLPFNNGVLKVNGSSQCLRDGFEKYSLKDDIGTLTGKKPNSFNYTSLASANDDGATWTQIADFIEKYPEKVFTNGKK